MSIQSQDFSLQKFQSVENDLKNFVYIHLRGGRENIKAMDEKLKILNKQELLVNKSLENFKNKIENSSDVDVLMETNRLNYICSETDSVLESNDTAVPHLEIDLHNFSSIALIFSLQKVEKSRLKFS
jgi:predicted DNA-binding protein YlxM (UPF0122 family)